MGITLLAGIILIQFVYLCCVVLCVFYGKRLSQFILSGMKSLGQSLKSAEKLMVKDLIATALGVCFLIFYMTLLLGLIALGLFTFFN